MFELSDDPTKIEATRDGCKNWCESTANDVEANCCTLALFGNDDSTEFQAYCALYQITEGQIYMPSKYEESGLRSYYSSNLMTDIDLVFDLELPVF